MTNEKINIAIAKACGWLLVKACDGSLIGKLKNEQGPMDEIPHYCNDLNAMHEAEKVFDTALYCRYINELCDLTIKGNNSMYMATARQRAEAFLRTINKWEGGSDE
jgi:hypothetical protein